MYKINCPFCEEECISDVIDSRNEVDGEWMCPNGHIFFVKFIKEAEYNE